MRNKQLKITQKKEDCHYEATLWDNRLKGGWYPFLFGFGFTQEEADTSLLKELRKLILTPPNHE